MSNERTFEAIVEVLVRKSIKVSYTSSSCECSDFYAGHGPKVFRDLALKEIPEGDHVLSAEVIRCGEVRDWDAGVWDLTARASRYYETVLGGEEVLQCSEESVLLTGQDPREVVQRFYDRYIRSEVEGTGGDTERALLEARDAGDWHDIVSIYVTNDADYWFPPAWVQIKERDTGEVFLEVGNRVVWDE